MKLPEDNLNRKIKSHFEDMEIPMSGVDELWDKIEQKKKRRIFPFWLLGVGLLILCSTTVFILLNRDQVEYAVSYDHLEIKETQLSPTIQNKREDAAHTISDLASGQSEKAITQIVQKSPLAKAKTTKTNNSGTENQRIDLDSAKTKTSESNSKQNPITPTTLPTSQFQKPKKETQSTLIENEKASFQKLSEISPLASLLSVPSSEDKKELPNFNLSLPQSLIRPLRKNQGYFFVEAGGQAYKTLDSATAGDDQSMISGLPKSTLYSLLREQHFDVLVSAGASFSIGYNLNEQFDFRLGLDYLRTETQFVDRGVSTERTIAFDSTAFYLRDNFWIGQNLYGQKLTNTLIYEKVVEQRLSIPLSIAFKFLEVNKLKLKLDAGVIINLKHSYTGRYIDDELAIKDHDETGSHLSNSTSYSIGLVGLYAISEHLDIYLNPQLRFHPNNLNSNLVSLSRTYLGSQLGCRLRI